MHTCDEIDTAGMGWHRAVVVGLLACGLTTGAAAARTFETREAAFSRLFPGNVVVDRHTEFLSEEQMQQVQQRAGARLQHARVTHYVISKNDSLLGRAYLDTHPVRSMQETLLIVLTNDGHLSTVEVLAFHEPMDYLPTHNWYERLRQLLAPETARPGDGVDAVSGATLTVNATCEALRRVRCIDDILYPRKQELAP